MRWPCGMTGAARGVSCDGGLIASTLLQADSHSSQVTSRAAPEVAVRIPKVLL